MPEPDRASAGRGRVAEPSAEAGSRVRRQGPDRGPGAVTGRGWALAGAGPSRGTVCRSRTARPQAGAGSRTRGSDRARWWALGAPGRVAEPYAGAGPRIRRQGQDRGPGVVTGRGWALAGAGPGRGTVCRSRGRIAGPQGWPAGHGRGGARGRRVGSRDRMAEPDRGLRGQVHGFAGRARGPGSGRRAPGAELWTGDPGLVWSWSPGQGPGRVVVPITEEVPLSVSSNPAARAVVA